MTITGKAAVRIFAALFWMGLLGVGVLAWLKYGQPYLKGKLVQETSTDSHYRNTVTVAADAFSGYAFLRSEAFSKQLKEEGTRIVIEDDHADYIARAKALRDGKTQLAVFTIDAYIQAGSEIGEFPGSIVMVIDETRGDDAIVAYKSGVPNLEAMNHESAKFVLTPASPSEFLGRVVQASFNLPRLPEKWFEPANGAPDVLQKFRAADRKSRRMYILWEPYVSRALEDPDAYVVFDSSKVKGYVVDVLLAERGFLRDHPDLVKQVVETDLKTAFSYESTPGDIAQLVRKDAAQFGEQITDAQAQKIVAGLQWKNTAENYAHFQIGNDAGSENVEHLEDMITKITGVLVKTGAIPKDPLDGKPNTIIYDGILKQLYASNFHPGKKASIIEGVGVGTKDLEKPRQEPALPKLGTADWSGLRPVASARVEPIVFGRGTAAIAIQSRHDLDDLARRFRSWPHYYLKVVGRTINEGDPDANRRLAQERANAAAKYLMDHGVSESRIRAEVGPTGAGAVSFILAEK